MHYQCRVVSAILILCDLLSNFFSKWLVATWNGPFLTPFSHTEALKLCFQRGAALYYLKWLMYRKLCTWSEAKKVLNITLIHLPLLYVTAPPPPKKKKIVGYLFSLKFLVILSFVSHCGFMLQPPPPPPKKKIVGYLFSLEFLVILSFVSHCGFMYVFLRS